MIMGGPILLRRTTPLLAHSVAMNPPSAYWGESGRQCCNAVNSGFDPGCVKTHGQDPERSCRLAVPEAPPMQSMTCVLPTR
jgi:hypothetical protein